MDYRIIEKPAFDLVGKSYKFSVADGELSRKASKIWEEYTATEEYEKLVNMTNWKFGAISEAPVMSAYLANEDGTFDPVVNAFGIEKTEKMDVKGFEVFHIPAATYAEFNCTLDKSSDTRRRIYSEWFPSSGYEHVYHGDIEAYFQVPLAWVVYVRWWIPVIKKQVTHYSAKDAE